jgi:hypothetical protein
LGALGDPTLDFFNINAQALFLTARNRIEEPQAVDKAPIAGLASVGHGDVIEGTLLGTTPR